MLNFFGKFRIIFHFPAEIRNEREFFFHRQRVRTFDRAVRFEYGDRRTIAALRIPCINQRGSILITDIGISTVVQIYFQEVFAVEYRPHENTFRRDGNPVFHQDFEFFLVARGQQIFNGLRVKFHTGIQKIVQDRRLYQCGIVPDVNGNIEMLSQEVDILHAPEHEIVIEELIDVEVIRFGDRLLQRFDSMAFHQFEQIPAHLYFSHLPPHPAWVAPG